MLHTYEHLKCLYQDWLRLKAPKLDIHSIDLRFTLFKYVTFLRIIL